MFDVDREGKELQIQCVNIFFEKNIRRIKELSIDIDDLVDKFLILKKQKQIIFFFENFQV